MNKSKKFTADILLLGVAALLASAGCAHQQGRPGDGEKASSSSRTEALQAEVYPNAVYQGGIALIRIRGRSGDPKHFRLSWGNQELRVFNARSRTQLAPESSEGTGPWTHLALLPVPHDFPAGESTATLRQADEGDEQALRLDFTVLKRENKGERIRVKRKHVRQRSRQPARVVSSTPPVPSLYETVSEEPLWDGAWRMPAPGAVTSHFGTSRVYNSRLKRSHLGVDLRARTGDPVAAPAGGRVIMAKRLFLSGRTVVVDHGLGVFTNYAHLSRIKVRTGELIEGGQILGLAGNTGRSSGPHLHWGAVVHGVKVDPLELLRVLD